MHDTKCTKSDVIQHETLEISE